MKKSIFIPLLMATSVLFTACGNNGADIAALSAEVESTIKAKEELVSKVNELESKNKNLQQQLDEIMFGPEKLLEKAKGFYAKKDVNQLVDTLKTIEERHPSSNEAIQIKALNEKLTTEIKKAEDQKKAEENKKVELEKKRLQVALANMRKSYDEVKELTWFHDKSSSEYIDVNGYKIYFGKFDDGTVSFPRIVIQYAGDDWVFVDRYIIKVDDETFTLSPNYGEIKRDNDGGGVWEYYDYLATKSDLEMVKKIASSKKTIIRNQGDQHSYDYTVTAKEKIALQRVLDAYEAIGGTEPIL